MAVTSRRYEGEADYARMQGLLTEICAETGPPEYGTVGDLDWWRFTEDDPAAIEAARLWFDGERLVGFAWPGNGQLDLFVLPDYQTLLEEMITWAECETREAAAGDGEDTSLNVWAHTTDSERIATLARLGYRRTGSGLVYRLRSLAAELPEPRLAEGYRISDMRDGDVEQRVAVHRDAFHPSGMTVEKHRAVMGSPTYRPDLDLVVVAPDGTYAAYCIVWLDGVNRLAVFEPVGSHSAHRRLGLAAAVMSEGMRRARELGAETICVLSNVDEPGPNRLYASLGFEVIDTFYHWKKDLSAT
jgi:mycothiol synthase